MLQNDFITKRHEHGCSAYHSLVLRRAGGDIYITFYYDPAGNYRMVWVFLNSRNSGRDVRSVRLLDGAYSLRDDWGISLFRDNARSVWAELIRDGWVHHEYGSTGYRPTPTK